MFFRAFYLNKTTVLIVQAEGVPNITGYFGNMSKYRGSQFGGVFYEHSSMSKDGWTSGGGEPFMTVGIDASRSTPVYGNSDHVTPSNLSIKVWQRIS